MSLCVCVFRRFLSFCAKFKAEFLELAAGCSVIKDWSFAPTQAAHVALYVCVRWSADLRKGSFDCVFSVCLTAVTSRTDSPVSLWILQHIALSKRTKQTMHDILFEFTLCSVSFCDFACLCVVESWQKHITCCKIKRVFQTDLKRKESIMIWVK